MKCFLCGSELSDLLFSGQKWKIVKCRKCGMVSTIREENINYLNYWRDTDYKKSESQFRNIFNKRYKTIVKFKKGTGRVLEIGCSTGILLSIFKEHGWEVWGIEPSLSANRAKKNGIRVLRTTLEKAPLPLNHFDVVILNHTLEHLDNPLSALKKSRQVLVDRGLIYISVPNFGGLTAKLLRKRWPYLLPLEHNFHFTKETLVSLAKKAGFSPAYLRTHSGIFDYANPMKELFSSLFGLKKRFVTDTLFLPEAIISTIFDKGSNLVLIAKK